MAKALTRIGTRRDWLPGTYNKAGRAVWLITNSSGNPHGGVVAGAALGGTARGGAICLAGIRMTFSIETYLGLERLRWSIVRPQPCVQIGASTHEGRPAAGAVHIA